MTTTMYATYDGEVFRPEGPILIERNTRVRVTIEAEPEELVERTDECEPYGFLRILEAANLDGPPDWSERLHYYLYGEGARSDD